MKRLEEMKWEWGWSRADQEELERVYESMKALEKTCNDLIDRKNAAVALQDRVLSLVVKDKLPHAPPEIRSMALRLWDEGLVKSPQAADMAALAVLFRFTDASEDLSEYIEQAKKDLEETR